jgi:glycosyltransferase involved in cell wall biosynthesis
VKEGWGLVVLEAMSADLPVVASDIPVLHEYLTDHETAVLTLTGDPQSLADGLLEVVADGALRERLIDGGRSLVTRFSWERAATEHRALYGEIWAMSSHSGPAVRTRHTRSGA